MLLEEIFNFYLALLIEHKKIKKIKNSVNHTMLKFKIKKKKTIFCQFDNY